MIQTKIDSNHTFQALWKNSRHHSERSTLFVGKSEVAGAVAMAGMGKIIFQRVLFDKVVKRKAWIELPSEKRWHH